MQAKQGVKCMPKKKFFSRPEPEPEKDFFADEPTVDDGSFRFDGSFGDMQPLDLFADESTAADSFAAMLQPDAGVGEVAAQPMVDAQQDEPFFVAQPELQPLDGGFFEQPQQAASDFDFANQPQQDFAFAEPTNQNAFAQENPFDDASSFTEPVFAQTQSGAYAPQNFEAAPADLFAPQGFETVQPDTYGAQNFETVSADVFTPQSFDAMSAGVFDTQNLEMTSADASVPDVFEPSVQSGQMSVEQPDLSFAPIYQEASDDGDILFAATHTAQPDLFAVDQSVEDIFVPQPDYAIPAASPMYETPAPGFAFEPEQIAAVEEQPVIPFDIAEQPAAQQTAPIEETEQEELSVTDPDYVPKRKYKPVFPAPVPSALDELRAGIVRPTSPISDIAATQIPVVITAAEAAAAEAAAREAAAQAAQRAQEEQESLQKALEEQRAMEPEQPISLQPAEPELAYGYDGEIHPQEQYDPFAFAQQPAQEQPADFAFDPSAAPVQQVAFESSVDPEQDTFATNFAQTFTPVQEFTQEDATTMQEIVEVPQEAFYEENPFDFQAQAAQAEQPSFPEEPFVPEQDAFGFEDNFTPEHAAFTQDAPEAVLTPEQYAANLQATLGDDQEDAFQGDAFQQDGSELFGADPFGENLDMPAEDGIGFENDMLPFDGGAVQSNNPFESPEWAADEDDEIVDDGGHFGGGNHSYDDDMPPRGRGPKKSNSLMLIIILGVLLAAIIGVVLFVLFGGKGSSTSSSSAINSSSTVSSSTPVPETTPEPVVPAVDPIPRDEWYMKLVNRSAALTSDFAVKTSKTSDGVEVDERIVSALNQMLADAKAQGVNLKVVAGYRSYARQQSSYNARVNEFVNQGKTKEEAATLAAEITAAPGTSEHNLGLSADIQSKSSSNYADSFKDSAEAKWLLQNAATYGFILRYPEGKEGVTGFAYEPWHYRYVGVDQAARIVSSGLTLEEYLAQDAPTGIPGEAAAAPAEAGAADSSSASVSAAG